MLTSCADGLPRASRGEATFPSFAKVGNDQRSRQRDVPSAPSRPPVPGPALCIPGPAPAAKEQLAAETEPIQTVALQTFPLTPVSAQVKDAEPAMPPPAAAPQALEEAKVNPLRAIHHKAAQKHASLDSYVLRLRRREVVGGQNRPEEIMLMKFRREPWSVYFKWLGTEGQGREVVYVKGRHGNMIHSLTAAGDLLFLPGGKRFRVAPDSFLVKSKSRYPITDAGLGGLIDRFGQLVAANEKGDMRHGAAKYLGQLKRPEFEPKVEGVLQIIPAKSDPHLPRGGQRLWFFDTTLHLPVLIITQDDTGREVEYYCHDRFQFPVRLDDDDFDPDVLWKHAT
jgi:hypothetical protein